MLLLTLRSVSPAAAAAAGPFSTSSTGRSVQLRRAVCQVGAQHLHATGWFVPSHRARRAIGHRVLVRGVAGGVYRRVFAPIATPEPARAARQGRAERL